MPTEQKSFLTAYKQSIISQLDAGLSTIEHCLKQISAAEAWNRPSDDMNSMANLLIHLAGNVRQWLIVGLTDLPDLRERQAEFDDRSHRPPGELLEALKSTVDEACSCIDQQTISSLVELRRVQEWDTTGFEAIANSTTHFVGHVQEIVHMTRRLRGKDYEFRFVPQDAL